MSYKFRPISANDQEYGSKPGVSRERAPFNDKRLHVVYEDLSEKMEAKQSICVQHLAESLSESAQFYRFYGNEKVSVPELIKLNCEIKTDLSQTEVLCIGDSTSFNISKSKGRIKDFEQLGVLQDNKTKGFHAHVNVALNAKDGCVLGLTDLIYWHRKGKQYKAHEIPKTKRESQKWYMGVDKSNEVLNDAKRITYVFDREADDFILFAHIQKELQKDFVIRCNHDRKVIQPRGEVPIRECLSNCPVSTVYNVELMALDHYSWTHGKRVKRKARTARLEVRHIKVKVLPPVRHKDNEALELTAIQVKEITDELPKGEKALEWILWTTHEIGTVQDAIECIRYYLLRWTIEQLFRTMKKKGFQQESTELKTVDGILKQTTMAFKAASTVMQLVNARDGDNDSPIDHIFDDEQQVVLQKINERMQGKTEKQKNLFPSDQLSWGAWIIGRLGGWKGYKSQNPPGPMTMKKGLDKFQNIFEGYQLFRSP